MSLPEIVSREEWTAARVALLEQEKALTKARGDARRRTPAAADGGGDRGLPLHRREWRCAQAARPVRGPSTASRRPPLSGPRHSTWPAE